MSDSQRPGEITYYEDLGVDNAASAEMIREAFRTLARLLHPDQQTDPLLREAAEGQMRKLNRIYSVLSDPARRIAYDQSLTTSRHAPVIVFSGNDVNVRKLLFRIALTLTCVLGTFALIWYLVDGNGSSEARSTGAGKAVDNGDGDASDQITLLRAKLATAETERNSALTQLGRLRQKGAEPAPGPAAATSLKELVPAPVAVQSDSLALFSGQWTYARAPGYASPGGKSQYQPDFIELTLIEQNGALRGQYKSRYQVLDHAISPDVNFDFTGSPSGSSLECAWQGAGGAKGRLTLKLLPAGNLELAWNATDLGSQQWLQKGSATLIRK